jgi:hypothetical protein
MPTIRHLAMQIAIALLALFALFPAASMADETSVLRGKILFIVQMSGPNLPVDKAIRDHLESRGYKIRMVNQDSTPSTIADENLVIISSTISGKDLNAGWRQVGIPLLTWENDVLDDLAMTGKRHDVDFGNTGKERFLWIVNAPHPIAAGLPAGTANVFIRQGEMSWGKPGLGATTIATLYGQPDKAVLFTYEKGATMDYETLAPARRTMLFLSNDSFTNLSETGIRLFDAAVDWTAQLAH